LWLSYSFRRSYFVAPFTCLWTLGVGLSVVRLTIFAGRARKNIAQLKNGIDGKVRMPDHVWHYVGGGLVGGALVIRKH
jgi:hypothetical protein